MFACSTNEICVKRKRFRCFHSELVTVALLFAFALGSLNSDLLVVLLQRRQVLTSFGELALLHSLANVPVHEGALAVHEVELVVDPREYLCDGRAVRDHAY